jgi:hypothetical protein
MATYTGKKEKKVRPPHEDEKTKGFSKGEKDLYRAIDKINATEA